jgi:hypothetical protein
MPFNAFIVAFGIFVMPTIGYGPIWNDYNKVVNPCYTYWWTNLAFINNFYPTNFDEKCMGWTWFIPVYFQLSLTLPILLAVYKYLPVIVTVIFYTLLIVGMFALNMTLHL